MSLSEWKKVFSETSRYILAPKSDRFRKPDFYGSSDYLVFEKRPFYRLWVLGDISDDIVEHLLKRGVEILDKNPFDMSEQELAELLWTKRLHEHALYYDKVHHNEPHVVGNKVFYKCCRYKGYIIYNKLSQVSRLPEEGHEERYKSWIDNMLQAGVEILDNNPHTHK